MSNILGRIAALPVAVKVFLAVAALIVLGLSVVLSPLMVVLAVIVLIVALLAVFIQLLRRGSPRRWGIVAAVALVLVLVFSGISEALYGGGGQEQATSPEPTQEAQPAQPEETTTTEKAKAPTNRAEEAARESSPNEKDDDRGRYDAVATVREVVDGDTIEVEPAIDGEEEVRLIGVDTPETKDPEEEIEPYGPEASNYTSTELEGEKVELEFDDEKEDQYGRVLAYVYPRGEDMFNEDLLELGYAQVYTVSPNDRYEDRFEAAQEEARADNLGIWGLSHKEQCKLADRGNGIGEGTPGCESGQKPAPKPVPAPSGGDLDCADFDSEGEAQAVLEDDPSDPHRLDADDDGLACEESVGGTASPTASPTASSTASPSPTASPEPSGGLPAPPPDGDYDCSDLTYSQAQQVLASDPSDPHDLDGDGNGIACE